MIIRHSKKMKIQEAKIFQYCTCPAGLVTYSFYLSCKHMHLSFKSVCNKEHKGVICNYLSILDFTLNLRALYPETARHAKSKSTTDAYLQLICFVGN